MKGIIKISLFVGHLNIGGTEKNVVNILKHIDRKKFETRLCCFYSGGPFEHEIKHRNIPTAICDHRHIYSPMAYFKSIRAFWKSDILHCFGYTTIYFGVFLGRLAGVKRIIVAIQDRDVWKKWYFILLDKMIQPLIDLYIADGEGTRAFAIEQQNIKPEKIITIYDGADIDALKPQKTKNMVRSDFGIPENVPVVGVICRLDDKKKGVSYFIQAIPSILEKHPDTRFLIVGDGEDRSSLELLSNKLQVRNNAIFAGFRTDLPDILNILDIFVIPSLWESVPKILVDAMASGKTIVATQVGDIPELLTDRESGILIKPGDPKEISDAVNLLLQDKHMSDELSRGALKKVEESALVLKKSIENLQERYGDICYKNDSYVLKVMKGVYLIFLICVVIAALVIAGIYLSPKMLFQVAMRRR